MADGKHFTALGIPPAEPYQPPTDRRPGGWPKTGTAGARETMAVDTALPPPLPARPYVVFRDAVQALEAVRRPDPAPVSPELRHRLITLAIGWFRR